VAKIELFQGFFSYTHLDAEIDPDLVEALTTRLEMRVTRKLTNASFSIWRDVDKIRTGQQWNERIGVAVRASQVFIVPMTPKWFERDYCRKEYQIFQEVEQGIAVGEHVVPLLAHAIKPQDFDQEQKATFDDLNRRQYKKTIATTFRKMTADQRELIVDEIADDIEGMIERLRAKSTSPQPRAAAQQAATEQKGKAEMALADEQRKPEEDRINVDAAIIRGASDGWFLPGNGKAEWFKDHEHGPEMVVVPAGSFIMGSPASEEGRSDDEGPQHTVTIGKPFAVGKFAVTFDEWDACAADGGCKWLQTLGSGLGPGASPGDQCVMARCDGLCGVAVAQDRQDLPASERGGVGICGACRHDDVVLVGRVDLAAACEL
jgi:hypothetical protein